MLTRRQAKGKLIHLPQEGWVLNCYIKLKNPWKTVGTALLATAFPVGTAIAGAVAVGGGSKKRL